ncbi:MAG: hypothetical protein [Microviridae sp.]|nr:MAG: hypothetical protein [Microviridae sp.]
MITLEMPNENFSVLNEKKVGETIEEQVRRMVNNGAPIGNPVPLIYTERKDGVLPQYDIRADKYDIAIESMTIASKAHSIKREERLKPEKESQASEGTETTPE